MLLSMHIPKTAGMSLRTAFEKRFGNALLLAYPRVDWAQSLFPLGSRKSLDEQGQESVLALCRQRDVQCIHGHFPMPALQSLFPEAMCITFLRDPVQRVISSYDHKVRKSEWAKTGQGPTYMAPGFSERMSFESFISAPDMRNVYEQFGVLDCLESLTFIGLTEQYERSLRLLERRVPGLGPLSCEKVNVHEKYFRRDDVTPEMMARVRELNDADVQIYEAARDWFEAACAASGI